ncbi:MAG: NmrA family NAD(P)-binding protein [Acidobacteriota bacterium]
MERYLKKSGLSWTFLRPSFFMQNLSTTHAPDICEHDEVYIPAGNGRTNFIDVADVAEAAAVVLTQDGHASKAYGITGSEALTYECRSSTRFDWGQVESRKCRPRPRMNQSQFPGTFDSRPDPNPPVDAGPTPGSHPPHSRE